MSIKLNIQFSQFHNVYCKKNNTKLTNTIQYIVFYSIVSLYTSLDLS